MSPSNKIVEPLRIRCAVCQQESYLFREVNVAGMSEREMFEAVQPAALLKGWAVRDHPTEHVPYFIGPKCLAQEKHDKLAVPKYSDTAPCPKCGHKKLMTKYMTGREPTARVHFEHIERTCKNCRYSFPQRVLAESKPKTA